MGISGLAWRQPQQRQRGLRQGRRHGTVEVNMDPSSIDFGLSAMNDWARSPSSTREQARHGGLQQGGWPRR